MVEPLRNGRSEEKGLFGTASRHIINRRAVLPDTVHTVESSKPRWRAQDKNDLSIDKVTRHEILGWTEFSKESKMEQIRNT